MIETAYDIFFHRFVIAYLFVEIQIIHQILFLGFPNAQVKPNIRKDGM